MPKCEEIEEWIPLLTQLPLNLAWSYGKNGFVSIPLLMRLLCVSDSDTVNEGKGEVEKDEDKAI